MTLSENLNVINNVMDTKINSRNLQFLNTNNTFSKQKNQRGKQHSWWLKNK